MLVNDHEIRSPQILLELAARQRNRGQEHGAELSIERLYSCPMCRSKFVVKHSDKDIALTESQSDRLTLSGRSALLLCLWFGTLERRFKINFDSVA